MKIKMELLSDAIFGNGMSVPGGEDISVLRDMYGFPYYKGSTFKEYFEKNYIDILNGPRTQIQRKRWIDYWDLVAMTMC